MDDTSSIILDRLLQATGLRRYSQLAELLGVSPQAISQARRKGRIPDGWILKLAARFQLSTDWLCYGVGTPSAEHPKPTVDDVAAPVPAVLPGSVSALRVDYTRGARGNRARQGTPLSTGDMHNAGQTTGQITGAHTGLNKGQNAEQSFGQGTDPARLPYSAYSAYSAQPAQPAHPARPSVSTAGVTMPFTPLQGNAILSPQGKSAPPLFAEVPLPQQSRDENSELAASSSLDVALIPLVGARLAAGAGSLETDADVQGYFAFRQDWLCRKGNPDRMVLMKVFGDSMEPDIRHGDMVLVNQGHTQIFGHAIYAVGVNEEIYIKQVETRPGGLLRLRSLNPRYEPIEVNLHGDLESSVRIIGRVIWWCREA